MFWRKTQFSLVVPYYLVLLLWMEHVFSVPFTHYVFWVTLKIGMFFRWNILVREPNSLSVQVWIREFFPRPFSDEVGYRGNKRTVKVIRVLSFLFSLQFHKSILYFYENYRPTFWNFESTFYLENQWTVKKKKNFWWSSSVYPTRTPVLFSFDLNVPFRIHTVPPIIFDLKCPPDI